MPSSYMIVIYALLIGASRQVHGQVSLPVNSLMAAQTYSNSSFKQVSRRSRCNIGFMKYWCIWYGDFDYQCISIFDGNFHSVLIAVGNPFEFCSDN